MKRAAIGTLVLSSLLAPRSALAVPVDASLRDACPDGRGVRVTNPRTGEVADVPCEDARAIIGLGRDAPGDREPPIDLAAFCGLFGRGVATITAQEAPLLCAPLP